MPSSVWSGYITFGLISIPVKLFSAARSEGVSFHMLHRDCGSRVKQQYICPVHERPMTRDEIVKGYEYEKGRYVTVEPEEIKKIEPETANAMEILEFVPAGEVDPLYFDSSYYLVPEEAGQRAYALLRTALEKSGYLGVARVAMHNREYTVVLRPQDNGLVAHTMFYQSEVRRPQELAPLETIAVKPKELELADSLIQSLAGTFDPGKFHDHFADQLRALVEAKVEGQPVVETEKPKLAPVIDLMAALKQSLEQARKTPGTAARPGGQAKARGGEAAEAGSSPQPGPQAVPPRTRPARGARQRRAG